jgi:hypothetical protein
MVCTYWWLLCLTGERKVEQDRRLEPDRNVQCAVSRKTEKYINTRQYRKPVWASVWWSSRSLDQCQITRWAFYTRFLWCYVCSNTGNSGVSWEISTHHYYVTWDVKMHHLRILGTHQRLYYSYKAKCVGAKFVAMTMDFEWAIRKVGGLLGTEQPRFCLMRLPVTPLQLSYCAACSDIVITLCKTTDILM